MARTDALQLRSEDAVWVADRALALASELGLPRPARALGYRGLARANLGDPGGLADYRAAIELATEAGQGREVALLRNNLAFYLWTAEGPAAGLEAYRDGIDYAAARGLSEMADTLAEGTLDALIDVGEYDEALEVVAQMVPRLESRGDVFDLTAVRAQQARILTQRGRAAEVAQGLDWIESVAREQGDLQLLVIGLGISALVRATLAQSESSRKLLDEVQAHPRAGNDTYYAALLPAMARAALGIGEPALAEALVGGREPRTPYAEHALVAADAALIEARGDLETAIDAYVEAADRWERFGVVPEQAFALLGQGRCLIGLSRGLEASPVLQHAREIFERLQAVPALAETDALLMQATATTS